LVTALSLSGSNKSLSSASVGQGRTSVAVRRLDLFR
jgi:hypothetical protein